MKLTIQNIDCLRGTMRPPSDKSLTHRAYMLGAAAQTRSRIEAPLTGEDCESTLKCLAHLGLQYDRDVHGVTLHPISEWTPPTEPLDCGNSGTTMRLLSGLIASRALDVTMVGDASLSKRPMQRIAEPLRAMGALVEGDTPPLRVKGRAGLTGIRYRSPVASAQVKSCILLAGLRASGETWVHEPSLSRDHTERMLAALGVPLLRDEMIGVGVRGGSRWEGFEFRVPADISSAAFFMVAAAILPTSRLEIDDLSINPSRTGIFDVFLDAGIPCVIDEEREELGEPVADIVVAAPFEKKRAFKISGDLVPRLIDEIPVLAVLATQCEGTTVIQDAKELRVKESDRIELVASGLRAMGATVETFEDGMAITGPTKLQGATIDAHHDHRIAMAFAIAGLVANDETTIEGAEAILTSFPGFENELKRLTV
ncbi:MAG: 3-phosphoshikimate 1-carboxyvinyltransferase [Fimbriimonadaceae bacterium]|nr:3-phosphoshikimate 1-carboxyvinyltransferase [Fimbriimonadaceae bacterium]